MKVRIYVAVQPNGEWVAVGGAADGERITRESIAEIMGESRPYQAHVVEAEVPDFADSVIEGKPVAD